MSEPDDPGDDASSTLHALWETQASMEPIASLREVLDGSDELLGYHAVCGLFAAVVSAPDPVAPSAWLEHIRGEHVFSGVQELQAFTDGLMELHNQVLESVGEYGAHCVPPPDEPEALRDFCDGYLTIATHDPLWEANESAFVELLPMFALTGATPMEKLAELLPEAKEDPEGWLEEAREALPDTVCALYDFWSAVRRAPSAEPVRRQGPKVGRNDPCPCGSGKKFKKCCAN